ncbi:unnamed protein product, partial [Musa textilis]
GANLTAKTKAGQTPIDLASTKEVRALLVECKQPLTKDDKSTTIMEKTMEAPSLKSQLMSMKKAQTPRKREEVKQLLMRTHQNLKRLRFSLITFWLKMMY